MTTVRVRVGWDDEVHGTFEWTPDGLVLHGDQEQLQSYIEHMNRMFAGDHKGWVTLSDEELVRSLPYRLRNRGWAYFVDADGNGCDEPPGRNVWQEHWGDPKMGRRKIAAATRAALRRQLRRSRGYKAAH